MKHEPSSWKLYFEMTNAETEMLVKLQGHSDRGQSKTAGDLKVWGSRLEFSELAFGIKISQFRIQEYVL